MAFPDRRGGANKITTACINPREAERRIFFSSSLPLSLSLSLSHRFPTKEGGRMKD